MVVAMPLSRTDGYAVAGIAHRIVPVIPHWATMVRLRHAAVGLSELKVQQRHFRAGLEFDFYWWNLISQIRSFPDTNSPVNDARVTFFYSPILKSVLTCASGCKGRHPGGAEVILGAWAAQGPVPPRHRPTCITNTPFVREMHRAL